MKRQLLKLVVPSMAICLLAGCADSRETIASQKHGNWTKADPSAITSAKLEPEASIMPRTHFAAAALFENQGALNKAILQYNKALASDPNHVPSLNRLGILYARFDRHQEAERALRKAINIEPNSPVLHNNLGFEYVLQRKWSNAAAEFRKAVELAPNFERARVNLGLCLGKLGQHEEALAEIRAVLEEPDAYYNLGLLFRAEHRYREAAEAFEIALAFNDKFEAAQTQLNKLASKLPTAARSAPATSRFEQIAAAPVDAPPARATTSAMMSGTQMPARSAPTQMNTGHAMQPVAAKPAPAAAKPAYVSVPAREPVANAAAAPPAAATQTTAPPAVPVMEPLKNERRESTAESIAARTPKEAVPAQDIDAQVKFEPAEMVQLSPPTSDVESARQDAAPVVDAPVVAEAPAADFEPSPVTTPAPMTREMEPVVVQRQPVTEPAKPSVAPSTPAVAPTARASAEAPAPAALPTKNMAVLEMRPMTVETHASTGDLQKESDSQPSALTQATPPRVDRPIKKDKRPERGTIMAMTLKTDEGEKQEQKTEAAESEVQGMVPVEVAEHVEQPTQPAPAEISTPAITEKNTDADEKAASASGSVVPVMREMEPIDTSRAINVKAEKTQPGETAEMDMIAPAPQPRKVSQREDEQTDGGDNVVENPRQKEANAVPMMEMAPVHAKPAKQAAAKTDSVKSETANRAGEKVYTMQALPDDLLPIEEKVVLFNSFSDDRDRPKE